MLRRRQAPQHARNGSPHSPARPLLVGCQRRLCTVGGVASCMQSDCGAGTWHERRSAAGARALSDRTGHPSRHRSSPSSPATPGAPRAPRRGHAHAGATVDPGDLSRLCTHGHVRPGARHMDMTWSFLNRMHQATAERRWERGALTRYPPTCNVSLAGLAGTRGLTCWVCARPYIHIYVVHVPCTRR